ncbi:hypothetical protein ACFY36_20280 [Actinoplanes sp. NPDC000266]
MVEQVLVAASDAARVTRASKAEPGPNSQAAAHLASLSNDLRKLVGVGHS